ncbi:MAG: glycosyltransferase family 4 protein [Candidatus Promineifilaceae bacterium]|jgi:glycosyltransferase involved in cell wall biosynthesis
MSPSDKNKQRLAFVGMRGLPPDLPGAGGGERETDAKTRRLAARGYEVTVYCRDSYIKDPPADYEGVKLIGLPVLSTNAGMETLSHTFLATLHAVFKDTADVINLHGMGNGLFLPLVKIGRKKSVVYMDGIDWERPKWGKFARFLLKYGAASAMRWADYVYVDNVTSQEQFAQIFKRQPEVITLGADLWENPGNDALEPLGLQSQNYILFVGMLRPDKGVNLLVEAYRDLETDIPLVIVGENPDDPAYVANLKARSDSRVKFLGYRYGEEARQLFANCLIYVQPSVMEGNSPALMSAMACGRCVVVNGIDQNRETIGDAGIAFQAGDVDDLRQNLEHLLSDPDRIQTLGSRARERITSVYNWERVVDQLEEVFSLFE